MADHLVEGILKTGAPSQVGAALTILVFLPFGGYHLITHGLAERDFGNVFGGLLMLGVGIYLGLSLVQGLHTLANACSHLPLGDRRISSWGCDSPFVNG